MAHVCGKAKFLQFAVLRGDTWGDTVLARSLPQLLSGLMSGLAFAISQIPQ
jgi:hypothetical protein